MQAAFEYLDGLPFIDMQPDIISANLPWVSPEHLNSWLVTNQAILESWTDIEALAGNLVDLSGLRSSIEANIAAVESYLTLPQKLQEYLHFREKYLYEILANVQAIQDLLGGWLYENGARFKAWVDVFQSLSQLWDTWQAIVDVFIDHDLQCGVCRNERWNLQHWLWIIIGAIIPEIPVIQMPSWPDIELDFSNIDLSLVISYPEFDFNFYNVNLPTAPTASLT